VPKRLLLALAVLGALLVPTQAVAAPKPTPTTGIDFDLVSFTQYGDDVPGPVELRWRPR
jgi:hypothetical protein